MSDQPVSLKRCSRCENEYPATLEYFDAALQNADNLFSWCRVCRRAYANSRYVPKPRKAYISVRPDGTKQCTACKGVYPATTEHFHRHRRQNKVYFQSNCITCERARKKEYASQHKEQSNIRNKRWRELNPIRVKANNQRYCDRHRERVKESSKRYRVSHADRVSERNKGWAALNPDRIKEYSRRRYTLKRDQIREQNKHYRQTHPEQLRKNTATRKARERALVATFTVDDWQFALSYFGGCCAYCGKPSGLWHTLAQDHFVPVSKGGHYTPDNIVPACHARLGGENCCNNSKSNRDANEWLVAKFGKRKAKQIADRIAEYFEVVKQQDQ